MNLFQHSGADGLEAEQHAPLATRMRPRCLDEFVGQEKILGKGSVLRRAIENDAVGSLIFWGPPGCGKTTLALIIAEHTDSHFENFSAVTSGVADVRRVVSEAVTRLRVENRRTILFIDEIHRFNRAQQDAFLPHVESGRIILIGATTENPYFSVNTPLLSRAGIYRFEPLDAGQVEDLLRRALSDEERGLGSWRVDCDADALQHLAATANGDARRALNALELAALSAPVGREGRRRITLELAEEAVQRRVIAYDKSGDQHYDVISAFIKSVRGSDVDAALYWLARMIVAGEDPRFIARRLVILAAEDVGNADPMGLVVANAAAHAVEFVGMPEAQIPLAQATVYLSTAPKSNASYVALNRALEDVQKRTPASVPIHLRDASYRGASALGHGIGYRHPHDAPGHFVAQEYLPEGVQGQVYYEPSDQGREARIADHLRKLRALLDQARKEAADRRQHRQDEGS